MAKLTFNIQEFANKLYKLDSEYEAIAQKALAAGAAVMYNQMKENLHKVISDKATGDLEHSLGIAPVLVDKRGNYNTKIGFHGYDRKGTSNQLKARALDAGTFRQRPRPFQRPAARLAKQKATLAMIKVVNDAVKNIMK